MVYHKNLSFTIIQKINTYASMYFKGNRERGGEGREGEEWKIGERGRSWTYWGRLRMIRRQRE